MNLLMKVAYRNAEGGRISFNVGSPDPKSKL